MKYKNITTIKYQIIQHIINKYAEKHDGVKPILSYDKRSCVLDIGGISKPINFSTESIGSVPQGAYEVVAQAIRSKDVDGKTDNDGMTIYDSATRIFSLVDSNQQDVFDFISDNCKSSYCACCGTNRDRNNFFYIRNVDDNYRMYQVGSSCIREHFDTSYFDLMKDISDAIDNDDVELQRRLKDYNLVDYLALYNVFADSTNTIAQCHKFVIDTIGCLPTTTNVDLLNKYHNQKAIDAENISKISSFYESYPDYMQKDNMLAIKTIQSMNSMVNGNIDIDPYYSKTHCMQVVKQYLDVLAAYKSDLRRYNYDLFKYNANLAQNQLIQIWRNESKSDYQITFSLNKRVLSGQVNKTDNATVNALGIDVQLTETGEFADESKAISDMKHFVTTIDNLLVANTHWNDTVNELLTWKNQCVDRFKHNKPQIVTELYNNSFVLYDYISSPLVITPDKSGYPANGMDEAKRLIDILINDSYVRTELNSAYKKFSTKYFGDVRYAHKQPKELNLSFNCEYLNIKYSTSVPKANPKFCAFVSKDSSSVLIEYGKAIPLKFATTNVGIICGADYDIDLKVMTFVCAENGLPAPRRSKPREKASDSDVIKNRPQKYVKRAFASAGISSKTLLSIRDVNTVNNTDGSCGVTVPHLGKILFKFSSGMPLHYKKDTSVYCGKIYLDGHKVSDDESFDIKTLINATHALEFLICLTDSGNRKYSVKTNRSSASTLYNYSYPLVCGDCSGKLEFSIVETNGVCKLKSAPRFVFTKRSGNHTVSAIVNLSFTQECWDNIKSGSIKYSDISFSGNRYVSGSVWVDSKDSQQITRDLLTSLTGLSA